MTQGDLFGARKTALLSEDGAYRYRLERIERPGRFVLWIMLNPSTADAIVDDHTIRKVIGFMKLWGFDGAIVVNLFAWRSTDPKVLARVADPIGERNNFEIVGAARECQQIVCAWGNHGSLLSRDLDVLALLRANCKDTPIRCLGVNRNGSPEHPARVPYDAQLCPLLL